MFVGNGPAGKCRTRTRWWRWLRLSGSPDRMTYCAYLFRGVIRGTGRVVEGHVQANEPDEARNHLSENGIVTESLREDPVALNLTKDSAAGGVRQRHRLGPELQQHASALRSVDRSLQGQAGLGHRPRQNPHPCRPGRRCRAGPERTGGRGPAADAPARRPGDSGAIRRQPQYLITLQSRWTTIGRLASFINQAEGALAAITAAARRMDAGSPRRMAFAPQELPPANHEVLLEIFKSNLELKRSLESPPPGEGSPAPPPAPPLAPPATG